MSSWRPLVEVLSAVDDMPPMAPPSPAASSAAAEGPPEPAGYGRHLRGRVPAPQSEPQEPAADQVAAQELEAQRRAAYQEGMALARQESEALALRYRDAIEALAHTREQVVRSCERDLVRLALTIAREVLMADVPGREHFTQRMVEHALSLMGDAQTMTLRMAPQDLMAMRQHKPELMRRMGLNWVEDPSLALGGVVVEADRGKLDATIAGRLEAMAQKLLQDEPQEIA